MRSSFTFSLILSLVCMAKTQYSFSHDPKLKGVPSGEFFLHLLGTRRLISFRVHDTYPCRAPFGWRWVLIPHPWRDEHHARTRDATVCFFVYLIVIPTDDQNSGFWEVGLDPESGRVVGLF